MTVTTTNPASLFVEARQWLDKSGGNSYFSARIRSGNNTVAFLPFQYGYESQYQYEALKVLRELGLVSVPDSVTALWQLRDYGVTVYSVIYDAKKADVVRFGKDGF